MGRTGDHDDRVFREKLRSESWLHDAFRSDCHVNGAGMQQRSQRVDESDDGLKRDFRRFLDQLAYSRRQQELRGSRDDANTNRPGKTMGNVLNLPLRIVHVIHPPILGPGPEQMLLTFEGAEIVGEELLQAAVDRAGEVVAGRVPVTKRLGHGPVVPVLVELSESADRVVLQHRHMSGLQRVFTGSVCSGVAGCARVPVVSVPGATATSTTRPSRMDTTRSAHAA